MDAGVITAFSHHGLYECHGTKFELQVTSLITGLIARLRLILSSKRTILTVVTRMSSPRGPWLHLMVQLETVL
jgi:hypothetical protein